MEGTRTLVIITLAVLVQICQGILPHFCCQRFYTDGSGWKATCNTFGCPSPMVGFFYGFRIVDSCDWCEVVAPEQLMRVNSSSSFCCHDYYSAEKVWDNEVGHGGCPVDHDCINAAGVCLFGGFTELDPGDICVTPGSAKPVEAKVEPMAIAKSEATKPLEEEAKPKSEAVALQQTKAKVKEDFDISFCCEYENGNSQLFWSCSEDHKSHCPPALNTPVCQGKLCYLTGFTTLNSTDCSGCQQPVCSLYDGDCFQCSQRGACGYCYKDGTCHDYTGQCSDPGGLTRNLRNCPAGPCSQYSTCGDCAKDSACGWCVGQDGDPKYGRCLYQSADRSQPRFSTCSSSSWLGSSSQCSKMEYEAEGLTAGQIAGIIFGVMAFVLMVVGLVAGWRMWLAKRSGHHGEARSLLSTPTPLPTSPMPEQREMSAP